MAQAAMDSSFDFDGWVAGLRGSVESYPAPAEPKIHTLWATPALPRHWVAEGTDAHWYLVPVTPGGWGQRRPYRGHREGLQVLENAIATMARSIAMQQPRP